MAYTDASCKFLECSATGVGGQNRHAAAIATMMCQGEGFSFNLATTHAGPASCPAPQGPSAGQTR